MTLLNYTNSKNKRTKGAVSIVKDPTYHSTVDFVSDAVMIHCGDYRPEGLVKKYLKRMHGIRQTDNATTASGSRTVSLYGVGEEELELFKIKQAALFIDVEKYLHHGAKKCVIACHSLCGFWPEFDDQEEEFKAHYHSLLQAGKIIKEKYTKFEEVILLYVVLSENKPHVPVEVIEINLGGEYKIIDLKTEPRMAC